MRPTSALGDQPGEQGPLPRGDARHGTGRQLLLTGTPLQNRMEELISIVQFVDRQRLGPTWRLLHEHQLRDEGGG